MPRKPAIAALAALAPAVARAGAATAENDVTAGNVTFKDRQYGPIAFAEAQATRP